MVSDPAFYALYFVDHAGHALSENVATQNFDEQMCIYLGCCETLSRSLRYYTGYELTVLTNDQAFVERESKELRCLQIPFDPVPRGVARFFASMHRLSVYKYFASCPEYSLLIESDSLCLNPLPINLRRCIDQDIPTYYDLTEQVYPPYGREQVLLDKERLMGGPSTGMWAGGDFIGGDAKFFQDVCNEIDRVKRTYWATYEGYFHQGDEMLTSVAVEKISRRRYMCDVGRFGGMGRYWSIPTTHVQRPTLALLDHFLVHLPADKPLLASYTLPGWIPKIIP